MCFLLWNTPSRTQSTASVLVFCNVRGFYQFHTLLLLQSDLVEGWKNLVCVPEFPSRMIGEKHGKHHVFSRLVGVIVYMPQGRWLVWFQIVLVFWRWVFWRGSRVSGFSLLAKPYLQISIGRIWKRSIPSLFFVLSHVLPLLLFWTLSVWYGLGSYLRMRENGNLLIAEWVAELWENSVIERRSAHFSGCPSQKMQR